MSDQCDATKTMAPASAIMPRVLGEALNGDYRTTLRCEGETGHDGLHYAYVCPFPGFADQRVNWVGASSPANENDSDPKETQP